MRKSLLLFECRFYQRTIGTYLLLTGFLALGLFAGLTSKLSLAEVDANSPYTISLVVGLLSLSALFPITLLAAQSLLREQDSRFDGLLYTTPVRKNDLLITRFMLVFGLSLLCLSLLVMGLAVAHFFVGKSDSNFGSFNSNSYLHAFTFLVIPNVLFCSAVVCSTAWLSRNKLMIYLSGLLIYVLYMVASLFSNSPLMANASPMTAEAMAAAALTDPFGLSAFFEQTRYWSADERNSKLIDLTGHFLLNRIWVVLFSVGMIMLSIRLYSFRIAKQSGKKERIKPSKPNLNLIYRPIKPNFRVLKYTGQTWLSFIRIDLRSMVKGIPFYLLLAITTFVLCMETYAQISAGMRIPERYATTGLMVNTLLESLPLLVLVAIVFFGSEWFWKSEATRFAQLENSTPVKRSTLICAKIGALIVLVGLLITMGVAVGIITQMIYGYATIDWTLYASLYVYIGVPAILCTMLVVGLHDLSGNKYIGLTLGVLLLILTNASIGRLLGFAHPLVRFANFLPGVHSDLNGFGYYPALFQIKMAYSLCLVILLLSLTSILRSKKRGIRINRMALLGTLGVAVCTMVIAVHIFKNVQLISAEKRLDWQQGYEVKYRPYQFSPQPSVSAVNTTIHLFPNKQGYRVSAEYQLINHTNKPTSEFLVHTSRDVIMDTLWLNGAHQIKKDEGFGQYLIHLKKALAPSDSVKMGFSFAYTINPWKGHDPVNAIVQNGAFMRISNYFPRIGYQSDLEIENDHERALRAMPSATPLKLIADEVENPYPYDFIDLDMLVSTSEDQTVVGIGELVDNYQIDDRTYFQFNSQKKIPFRFGLSSAVYAVQKEKVEEVSIEVYYDPAHAQNVNHLIERIKESLVYCMNNFGPYPFKTIRFAEISSFTSGFAGTAYPATIFMNEDIFHLNLSGDHQQDIINQLAGHELAHQWWGTAQVAPDERQGSRVLTETLAMYTELMLYKAAHGQEKMQEMVLLHEELYLSERGFSSDEPLYLADPANTNLVYNKGLLAMHELYQLIGEESINKALKNLLEKHGYPNSPPTTLDLLRELNRVSNSGLQREIDAIFME